MTRRLACLLLTALLCTPVLAHDNTLVPEGAVKYVPTQFPDRIVLTPAADPARGMHVSWRTDDSVSDPRVQISIARDSSDLYDSARDVLGEMRLLTTENGTSHHHQVTLSALSPDTLYAYRVRGGATWSEWFHFRTAADGFRPFSFIYFGDAQNSVKSLFSRVIRGAWMQEPKARLMVHAGDLVNQRAGVHDDEWGEWFDAGGWVLGMIPSIVVAGNHEYIRDRSTPDNRYVLGPHWATHLSVARNGLEELPYTTYHVDFQGVRFITLDSVSALSLGTAAAQAAWLKPLLEHNPNRWTVVTYHHPMFSVSQGRDNPLLREHWKPLFDKYDVDLVLQGHDHAYGRGVNLSEGSSVVDQDHSTVYVVSVAGPKMYLVSDEADASMQRTAEDTQLYQIIRVEADRLHYESRTATDRLYDSFEILRDANGRKRIIEGNGDKITVRRCERDPVEFSRPSSCRDGVEWPIE